MRIINNKIFATCFLFALSILGLIAQDNKIVGLEYWFDGNTSSIKSVAVSPNSGVIETVLTAEGLPFGIHSLYYRVKDQKGYYSSTNSKVIFKIQNESNTGDYALEYWFDGNISTIKSIAATPKSGVIEAVLDAKGLPFGLHTLYYRVKNEYGIYSSASSKLFLKLNEGFASEEASIEYWFNNNETSTKIIKVSVEDPVVFLETADLPFGLNYVHMRLLEGTTVTRSMSKLFVKIGTTGASDKKALIAGYRYWIDGDMSKLYSYPIEELSDVTLVHNLPLNNVPLGKHNIHIQFYDNRGYWTEIIEKEFEAVNVVGIDNETSSNPDIYFKKDTEQLVVNNIKGNIKVYTVSGNIVYQNNTLTSGTYIPVSSWPDGIYVVTFQDINGNTRSVKVLK